MTVSASAHVPSNAPTVSPALPAVLRSPIGVKTIPFKNVLDALPAFELPSDESIADSGEQTQDSQGRPSKRTLPDVAARAPQQSSVQYVPPQVQFVPHQ